MAEEADSRAEAGWSGSTTPDTTWGTPPPPPPPQPPEGSLLALPAAAVPAAAAASREETVRGEVQAVFAAVAAVASLVGLSFRGGGGRLLLRPARLRDRDGHRRGRETLSTVKVVEIGVGLVSGRARSPSQGARESVEWSCGMDGGLCSCSYVCIESNPQ